MTESMTHQSEFEAAVREATAWRRHLHQHPELAFQEERTSRFVAAQLEQAGLAVETGIAGTGVVGTLRRGAGARSIGIRADMDALPIVEKSKFEYVSTQPGVMHACGHDGHVAMALAAATLAPQLADLDGTVHFIFQPAEENEGGGRRMVEEGLFRRFPCDAIYALHNWPALPLGTCVAHTGAMMAALATFQISVEGRGCHGAMPHQGTDAIAAASHIVSALQTIVSRNIDPAKPAVVSVTQIHAGDTWNVIPDTCVIRGTLRWLDESVGELIVQRVTEVATSVALALGCTASVQCERRFPVTVNHAEPTEKVRSVARNSTQNLKLLESPPSMGSEDFAFMLRERPGCYFWLGTARQSETPGLHSPRYDFNNDLLPIGIRFWLELILANLTGR